MAHNRRHFLAGMTALIGAGWTPAGLLAQPPAEKAKQSDKPLELFDGKSLAGWKVTDFGGQGEVQVEDGRIIIEAGERLSGITTTRGKELPRMSYEISLEAMRLEGSDFFCGLTFQVNKDPCSFIVGGWGGTVVGLSSLNGSDASENETTQGKNFQSNRWYRIRTRVIPGRIQCWIDDEQMVNVDTTDKEIGVRIEVESSAPLGICTYQTKAALRKIQVKKV